MNEDYLWNKSGESAEIEFLETKLQRFRQKSSVAPLLPKKIVIEKKTLFGNFFKPALAFAVCIVVAVFSAVFYWQFVVKEKNQVEVSHSVNAETEKKAEKVEIIAKESPPKFFQKAEETLTEKVQTDEVIKIKSKTETSKNFVPASFTKTALTSEKIKKVKKSLKKTDKFNLTEDEKFAYQQLMLALSITGKQLRIVTEKVNGESEKNLEKEKNNTK